MRNVIEKVSLDQHLNRVADQLARDYADRATPDEVRDAVAREAFSYKDARVTQFIPVLVQRAVQEQLRHRPVR